MGAADLLARVGQQVGACLRADATCMIQLDPETALPIYVVSDGWSDDDHRPLIEHALLASPAADPGRLLQQRRRTALVDELVAARQPYYRDPYFEYHLLLHGYRHELQAVCATAQRGRAFLTVTRRGASGAFEPRHRRLLDAVAPHVAAGMHAAMIRETLHAPPADGAGIIVLDERGAVELANAAGDRWLASPDAPGRPGRLWALHVLSGLLTRSLSEPDSPEVPAIELADPSTGALYQLRAERAGGADDRPRSIILLEPVRRPERVETLLRLGLTRREAEVTLAILRGTPLEMIAAQAGMSPHTAAQHVRNICTKLGVSSRRALMLRLSQGF